MKLLAISGSARSASTNTAFLMAMKHFLPTGVALSVFAGLR
jgi:NAD(P)H-dependent FMN reductase